MSTTDVHTAPAVVPDVEVDDPVLGRRRVSFADDGTPRRVERADGSTIEIERDDRRRTLRVDDDQGRLFALRVDGERVVATDREGETIVSRSACATRIERRSARTGGVESGPAGTSRAPGSEVVEPGSETVAGAVLRVDRDPKGRPRRVTVPGSAADLHYRRGGAGRWLVETTDGERVLTIHESRRATSVVFADGWGWNERLRRGSVELSGLDGATWMRSELDASGRVTGRVGLDGSAHAYERDDRQRLSRWVRNGPDPTIGPSTAEWQYEGRSLVGVNRDGRQRRHGLDDAGRTISLIGGGPTVRYAYDPNGARTVRRCGDSTTRYGYDTLGQLISVEHGDGSRTELGWDGLGRRVWVAHDGCRVNEHRDVDGRLWAVTDDSGRAVHTFIWWEGRVVARLDGPIGSSVAEAYLTDPVGTLLALAAPSGDGSWDLEDVSGDPRGAVIGRYRPTLFGHIADGVTGLIPFGCRDYDPECGMFLTADPWHRGPDDPRVLGGAPRDALSWTQESPADGGQPYALGQFDPLSRPDLDGHAAWGNMFLTLVLAPTWGFPLTSLSLFFFMPLNIYMEIFGLIAYIFTDHPWPQHSIVNLKGLAGSSQLGTFGIALNGFFPRVISGGGVNADRAVTIGHVVWENRRYFELLDRPRVLTVQDVAGAPDAAGKPSGDATAFSDTNQGSIVVVEGTDEDNRVWLHGSWWTRGGSGHLGVRGPNLGFEDRVAVGTQHSEGTLLLAQPLPENMATPMQADDDGELRVTEYGTNHTSAGELLQDQWFAITIGDDAGLGVGDAMRIQASDDSVPSVYAAVHEVIDGDDPILILDHSLPARFRLPNLLTGLALAKLSAATGADAGSSAGWVRTNPARKALRLVAPGHRLRTGDVLSIEPSPTTPAPERPIVYSEIETVRVALELGVALPVGQIGATLLLLAADGTVAAGTVPDPAAKPAEVSVPGEHEFAFGDAVAVGAAGGDPHHARISAIAGAAPAVLTLDPPIPNATVSVAGTAVNLARLEPSDTDRDVGTISSDTATEKTVEVRSNELFPVGSAVQVDHGGVVAVRTVSAIKNTIIVMREEMTPAGAPLLGPDFEITIQSVSEDEESGEIAANRFVRHTGGDLPSVYGDWPAEVMGLVPAVYPAERAPMGWRFFQKPAAPIAGIHTDYKEFWQPLTLAGAEYWLLASPVKITNTDGIDFWEPDPDDTYPRRHRQNLGGGPWAVTVRGFDRDATPVVRPLPAGGAPVLCRPAEAQVTDEPTIRWSLADALDEHELAHTLHNTFWGPFLGALPLQGLFRTVPDTLAAAGKEPEDWMLWNPFDEANDGVGFDDTNLFELLSMAGLMQLVWTFVILGPALGNDNARRFLLGLNFSDWGQVLNPVNQQIINQVPEIDPEADAADRWGLWAAHLATKGLDMRSWTPLIGLVPLLLPDKATNFIEQQASRWSGDLYSTILTVDDVSNRTLRLRIGSALLSENKDADSTISLGESARIMMFYGAPLDRFLPLDRCDAAARLTYLEEQGGWGIERDFVRVKLDAVPGGTALLPQGHFRRVVGPALPTREIDGPGFPDPSSPGATIRKKYRFNDIGALDVLEPMPRALVPVGPAVVRAVGFYFLPATPGTYTMTAYETDAGKGDEDPHTYHATVTVAGDVEVDGVDVPWTMPMASGAAGIPPAPAADDIARFETESVPMVVADQDTSGWMAEGGAGLTVDQIAGGGGWTVTFADPGPGLPARARLRIWRPVRPDDAELFDFVHEDEPVLKDIRTYLEDDTWLPVRDFSVSIEALPALPAATIAAADAHELALPVKLAGEASIVVTPADGRDLEHARVGDDPPRGEKWTLELVGRKAVESPIVFPVKVSFGAAAAAVDRTFNLTVEPNFVLDTAPAGGPYTVSEAGGALTLAVTGGTAPFDIEGDLPQGVVAAVDGRDVVLTADETARAGRHMVVVQDDDDKLGIREIEIEL